MACVLLFALVSHVCPHQVALPHLLCQVRKDYGWPAYPECEAQAKSNKTYWEGSTAFAYDAYWMRRQKVGGSGQLTLAPSAGGGNGMFNSFLKGSFPKLVEQHFEKRPHDDAG